MSEENTHAEISEEDPNELMTTESESGEESEEEESEEEDSDDDYVGETDTTMQHFHLMKKIGKGGFGVVWSAKTDKDDDIVALKIGKKDEASTREIQALKELEGCPYIIKLLDTFTHTTHRKWDHRVLVLPFYNTDLTNFTRDCEGVTLSTGQDIFRKILKGLDFMFQRGITHTDLKPSNILLNITEDQTVSKLAIADFGCASWDGNVCKYGKTNAYRSVNLVLNERASPEDDIWSTACILFEIFTNEYLFDPDPIETEEDKTNHQHLILMLELLGPFPKKMALKHRKHFNAKGSLMGNPKPPRLPLLDVIKKESSLEEKAATQLTRLLYSMFRYTKRQRPLISELLEDAFLSI